MKIIFDSLAKQLRPSQPFSWQSVILLSIFSWAMALLALSAGDKAINAYWWIYRCAFLFSIFGIFWYQLENKWKIFQIDIGPWIVGLVLGIFIFRRSSPDILVHFSIVSWPILAAIIAIIPKFLPKLKLTIPTKPDRPKILMMFFIHLAISCWLEFYFIIGSWVNQYPILLENTFPKSAFVLKVNSEPIVSWRARVILDSMEFFLQKNIENQRWRNVKEWIFNLKEGELDQEVKALLPQLKENNFWVIKISQIQKESGYTLELFAIWKGPSPHSTQYYVKKSCEITQTFRQPPRLQAPLPRGSQVESVQIARLVCKPASDRIFGEPKSL